MIFITLMTVIGGLVVNADQLSFVDLKIGPQCPLGTGVYKLLSVA